MTLGARLHTIFRPIPYRNGRPRERFSAWALLRMSASSPQRLSAPAPQLQLYRRLFAAPLLHATCLAIFAPAYGWALRQDNYLFLSTFYVLLITYYLLVITHYPGEEPNHMQLRVSRGV